MALNSGLVTRTEVLLRPDPARVLLRPFTPGDVQRAAGIVARIMALPEECLDDVTARFTSRHHHIHRIFLERCDALRSAIPDLHLLSERRRMLIGSYFLAEYSIESAALFNPSLVPHPDQTGLPEGALRFVLSLRATGEGHVSSITFRSGVIHADHRIEVVAPAGYLTEPRQVPNPVFEKPLFSRTLQEIGLASLFTARVTERLGHRFTLDELRSAIDAQLDRERHADGVLHDDQNAAQGVWTLARANHEVQFDSSEQLSERILFPATPSQRNGIEDARFVCFRNDDGSRIYYATFTAYDGKVVMPELVETTDFLRFRFLTLNGPAARNKGMALFPRRINGRYAMLSRQDNENIHIMFSENVHFWNEHQLLLEPAYPWELVQLGNCGSPIETEAGWLVLSHGVGPMREYSLGAFLLDRDDPTRVIGRLREPLLQPDPHEREGYVPNVVYTCGALIHHGELIIPYGTADHATRFATVAVDRLLAAMKS